MTARAGESDTVRLDLNNPVFQRQLFALEKAQQLAVLAMLRKHSGLLLAAGVSGSINCPPGSCRLRFKMEQSTWLGGATQ